MNSMHDAVQSRNGPAEAAANGERNGDVGLALLRGYGRRPPSTRTLTDSGAGTGVAEVCRSISRKLHLFIYYRK